ncbi:dihydroorotase [Mesonia sp.]|uniref:dihydroorotase n=1 Tax=Mesonia sp. TaxID=1960830 RepID=UPI003F9A73C2
MKLLIKSAKVIQPSSEFHQQQVDILIEDGVIASIKPKIDERADQILEIENLHLSEGWFDSSVSFGEPGYEERETLENGLLTAAKSGFTQLGLNSNINPIADHASALNFLQKENEKQAVRIYPIAALTKHSEGKDLAEVYDMHNAGAVSFYDYKKPVNNPNLLKIALQYVQNFDGLVQSFPLDESIAHKGYVHENKQSTILGLKGIPSFAEELQISRDLHILEYTEGKLHIPTLSTKKAVALIREAKKKGLDVSCSVAVHQLVFHNDKLETFNSHFKVMPPLRSKEDQEALVEGVKDGTIDMVTTDHMPIDIENKKVEFENALFGTIGLESAFGALNALLGLEKTIDLLTKAKKRFHIPTSLIKEGKMANFSFFNPKGNYTFAPQHIYSSSKNAMFLNHSLTGKALGVYAQKNLVLHESDS